jgi:hypothetical protein
LKKLVSAAKRGTSKSNLRSAELSTAAYSVPKHVRDLSMAELPVSKRLQHLSERISAKVLGDFDGVFPAQLLEYKNCGRRTVSELRRLISRADSGEFHTARLAKTDTIPELLRLIEGALPRLSPRDREMVFYRFGLKGGEPETLEKIGRRYGFTRERIRQILEKSAAIIRTAWGPRIPRLLDVLRERCLAATLPLTPELLEKWVGDDALKSKLTSAVQVRFIGLLDEEIPCWPAGHDGYGPTDKKTHALEAGLAEITYEAGGRLSFQEAFAALKKRRGHTSLTTGEFLKRLRHIRRLVIEFPQPDKPMLRVKRLHSLFFVTEVLRDTREALTVDEIIQRAVKRFGKDLIHCDRRAVSATLYDAPGIHRVSQGYYTMQKPEKASRK